MAVDFNNGTIFLNSVPGQGEPLTLAIWFNLDFGNTPETLIGVFSTTGGTSYFQIETTALGNKIFAEKNSVFLGSNSVTSSGTYTPGTWHHAAAVFYSSTHIAVFLDGVKVDNAALPSFGFFHPLVASYISGRWFAGSFERPVDGCLCRGAVWSSALSDAQITQLAAGALPTDIDPDHLFLSAPITTVPTLLANDVGPPLTSSGGPFVLCASEPPGLPPATPGPPSLNPDLPPPGQPGQPGQQFPSGTLQVGDMPRQRWLIRTGKLLLGDSSIDNLRLHVKRGVAESTTEPDIWVRANKDNRGLGKWKRRGLGLPGDRKMALEFGPFGCAHVWQFEIACFSDCEVQLRGMQVWATPLGH